MGIKECLNRLVERFPKAEQLYCKHMEQNGVLLSHIFFEDALVLPLILAFEKGRDAEFADYAGFIEEMWDKGDRDLRNVVDVSLLERISDDEALWKGFGKHISAAFKDYINNDLLLNNIMMQGVHGL